MITLMYHNVLAAPNTRWPVAAEQVTEATFRDHIRRLRPRLLHPTAVQEAWRQARQPEGVLVTFDDGAFGVGRAARILAENGGAGVAFVCPGAVECGLWFYRLAAGLVNTRREEIEWEGTRFYVRSDEEKREAYRTWSPGLFELPPEDRDARLAEILAALEVSGVAPPEELRLLDRAGLREAASTGGMLFASHSWSHPSLVNLGDAELEGELGQAEAWLEASGLPTLPWFAFPRGRHNPAVRKAVAARYEAAFGMYAAEASPGVVPRVYLRESDRSGWRFWFKTAFDGGLYARHQQRVMARPAASHVDD